MATKHKDKPQRGLFEKEPDSGIWWIRYTDSGGKYKREKVGRRSDAVKLLEKRRTDARMGVKMPENIRHRGVTFEQLAEATLTYIDQRDYRDKRNAIQRVNRLKEELGQMEAEKMLPSDIADWLSKNTKSAGTHNRYRSVFSLIFREAIKNRKVSTNPARLVTQARENNGRPRWLRPEERERLFKVMESDYPAHLPELTISLETGMRRGEQYALTWRHIDMQTRHINLTPDITKNGTARSIPMTDDVHAAFRTLQPGKSKDRVFANTEPHDWWDEARAKAGIEDYVWHANRHTFCTLLSEKDVPLNIIQRLAGHLTIAVTARYAKATDNAMRNAIEKLGKK